MIKILFKVFLYIIIFNSFNQSIASINNKIIVIVENKIISSYELKNKIKTILFLNGQDLNQDNINKTKSFAINALINNKLKELELSKYKIEVDEKNLNNKLNQVASNDLMQLKQKFKNNNLNFDLYKNELKTELKWQKLIYLIYNKKVEINDKQIDKELNEILKKRTLIEEVNLAEIEILIDNNSSDREKISNLFQEINKIGFGQTAKKLSISSTSSNNGNLGWISSKALSKKNFEILSKLKVGEISKPIRNVNSILVYKILDRRNIKSENFQKNNLKNNLIALKKNELFNLYSNSHLSKIKNTSSIIYK